MKALENEETLFHSLQCPHYLQTANSPQRAAGIGALREKREALLFGRVPPSSEDISNAIPRNIGARGT